MDNRVKPKPAVIVDYDAYYTYPTVRNFVLDNIGKADMILLATNPDDVDQPTIDDVNWSAVIKNTGNLQDTEFKVRAFQAISQLSNLILCAVIDESPQVRMQMEDDGVLFSLDPELM